MNLTPPQIRVLRLLAASRRTSSKTTHHDQISGACAWKLVSLGLARDEKEEFDRYFYITDAGREALKEAEELKTLQAACAHCKSVLVPTATLAITDVWKACVRCGVKTLYRIRRCEAST